MNVCVSEVGMCRAKLSAGMCLLVRLTMKVRKMRAGAILLLITELMTYYAPVDMQHGAHTNTKMAKSAPMFTQCGRQLWKELDSEMAG